MAYHDASPQSNSRKRHPAREPKFSRETQTYDVKNFGQTTRNDMSTQSHKPGIFISNCQDRLLTPGQYETSEEYEARILSKVTIIQKYWRGWLARVRVATLRQLRDTVMEWERQQEQAKLDAREKRLQEDLHNQWYPTRSEHFDQVFAYLEQWYRDKEVEISSTWRHSESERKTHLARLLDRHADLLAQIEGYRQCVLKTGEERQMTDLLRKAAAVLHWTSLRTGRPIYTDNQNTIRGRELLKMLNDLKRMHVPVEERLTILLELKRSIRGQRMKICFEIAKLVDRETELLMRNVSVKKLYGLRQRLASRFAAYARLSEVNPQIANYSPVPTGDVQTISDKLRGNINYCSSCDRYLASSDFLLNARTRRLGPCKSCTELSNRAGKRLDYGPYERMLIELRENEIKLIREAHLRREMDEKEMNLGERSICLYSEDVYPYNLFPFLINKEDVHYIVDGIWERRSVLSECLDIRELTLVRWNVKEPWSPWNTMLVTRDEAEAHERFGKFSLDEIYAEPMLKTVRRRLIMGRNAFSEVYRDDISMIFQEVGKEHHFKHPEASMGWRDQVRRILPLLDAEPPPLTVEERHAATYQPMEPSHPAIKEEKPGRIGEEAQ